MRRRLRAGGVDFLPIDDENFAVPGGAAADAREIGSAMRLAIALAERNLPADGAGDVVSLLLLGSGREDCRNARAAPAYDQLACTVELFFDDILGEATGALAAVLLRPTDAEPAAFVDVPEKGRRKGPAAMALPLGNELGFHLRGQMARDERLDLGPQPFFVFGERKVHTQVKLG